MSIISIKFFEKISQFEFIHSFIYFAINQKYDNSIQKYIKDNIQFLFRLSYLQD